MDLTMRERAARGLARAGAEYTWAMREGTRDDRRRARDLLERWERVAEWLLSGERRYHRITTKPGRSSAPPTASSE